VGKASRLLGCRQIIERPSVGPAFHVFALQLTKHLVFAFQHMQGAFGKIEHFISLAYFHVGQLGTNRRGDIAGQSPGCCRPDQQRLAFFWSRQGWE
jgi:hypothetical protein